MINYEQKFSLRAKKLGVLLYDARLKSKKSIDDIARIIDVSSTQYRDYESGRKSPSLPELEVLAYSLYLPVGYFFHSTISYFDSEIDRDLSTNNFRQIRDRIIGTRLRLSRIQLDKSIQNISNRTSIPANQINQYEFGQKSIPIPELEIYAKEVGLRMEDFFDVHGIIGRTRIRQNRIKSFVQLPENIQSFVCESNNMPYLKLAILLRDLSIDRLNEIAKIIIELTK